MKFNVPLCEGGTPSRLPLLAPRDKSRFTARAKPLAGLLFTAAIVSSIATSYAYPEWSAEAETEEMELETFVQPQIVHLELDGQLNAEESGYWGTELAVKIQASVPESHSEEDEDTGDSGVAEETGFEFAPVELQIEMSSASIGEEPLLLDVPLSTGMDADPTVLPWALVLPCEEADLSACSDDVEVRLVLSRPLEDNEALEGSVQLLGRASGPTFAEDAPLPEVELSLSVEPSLE